MLPNLIIIGAAKAGTTSLHDYLDQHPEVHMARPDDLHVRGRRLSNDAQPKEMRFWWRDDCRERLAWYEAHFDVPEPVRGEATPAYAMYPFHSGVAERIHAAIPEVRLIYLVRDPIDRVIAHWVQARVDGDPRPLSSRIAADDFADDPIVCASRYATQLERYLAVFPAEQILVVDQHELRHRRRETMREVFSFAGVDPDHWSDTFEREQNTLEDKRALTSAGAPLFNRLLDPAGRRIAPGPWHRARPAVRRALSRPVGRPELDPAHKARLEGLLQPEAERLRALTGRPFASWSL